MRAVHLLFGKDLSQRAIHALDAAVGRDRDHAGGNAFENRFGEAAAASSSRLLLSSSRVISLNPRTSAASSSMAGHFHAIAQIALAHLAGRVQQRGDRHADLPGQKQRDPGGDEQHEQRDQGQQQQG